MIDLVNGGNEMFKWSAIKHSKKNLLQAIFIIGILSFLMVSPQLYKHALIVSNDFLFHMNRFYDLSQQLTTGHFSYFQSLYGFAQSGRVVNAMYGMDFAIVQALLLTIVGTWFKFQLISSFLCFFVSGSTMYALCRYAKISHIYSIVAAIFYMSTATIAYYALVTNFSGWGAAFLPLALLPAVYMFQHKERPIKPLLLGLPIALLISVHLFSTVLAVLALVPFYVYTFIYCKNKWQMIKDTLLAVLIAVLLSANTFGSVLDLSGDRLIKPYAVQDMLSNSTSFSIGAPGWAALGLIFSFLFIFQAVSAGIFWKQLSSFEKLIHSVGLFFLLLSSKFVPWNSIAAKFTFIQSMQFPQRFVCVACILLLLGWGMRMQKLHEESLKKNPTLQRLFLAFFITLALLSCNNVNLQIASSADAWKSDQPITDKAATIFESDPEKIRQAFGGHNPLGAAFNTVTKSTSDYLPRYSDKSFNTYETYSEEILHNKTALKKTVTEKNQLALTWENETNNDEVLLPVSIYKRSTVTLNKKKLSKTDYKVSQIGSLILKAPKGENTVVIGYNPSNFFKLSLVIKIISLITLIIYGISSLVKKYLTHKN
jgi:hypothetical protein